MMMANGKERTDTTKKCNSACQKVASCHGNQGVTLSRSVVLLWQNNNSSISENWIRRVIRCHQQALYCNNRRNQNGSQFHSVDRKFNRSNRLQESNESDWEAKWGCQVSAVWWLRSGWLTEKVEKGSVCLLTAEQPLQSLAIDEASTASNSLKQAGRIYE